MKLYSEEQVNNLLVAQAKCYIEECGCRQIILPTLPEPAMEVDGWIDVNDRLPLAYKPGNFDGKQSDLVLTKSAKHGYNIALVYSGIIDGRVFNDWFDKDDFEISPPDMWKPLT